MDDLFRSYLSFLRSMSRGLASLTELNEKKLAAAKADDLAMLNELMNQDQAQSLNFRGLELTRDRLQPQLGLSGVSLDKVPERFPPELREEAEHAVTELRERYRLYAAGAKKTRAVLERNLQEVESFIIEMGGPEAVENLLGYRKDQDVTAPPPSMKTDFRA